LDLEVIDVTGCKKRLVAEVPAGILEAEIDKLAVQFASKASVPGFRPGRVPVHIIKQRYGTDLRNDAMHELINRSWRSALEQRNLKPLAEPHLEDVNSPPGDNLKFSVSFEILPKIDLKDYTGIDYRLDPPAVTDTDVDGKLEELRHRNAHYSPVEEAPIADGHVVTLKVDGEFAEGGPPVHEDEVVCVVGDPQTNPTFSENLRGARLGETRRFEVAYPEDYHRKKFAGRLLKYCVEIKDVKEKHLPDLTDEFAVDLFGAASLADLRARISDDLITNAGILAEKKAREAVLDLVVAKHSFDVPDCLVEDELKDHARRIAVSLAQQGIDVDKTSIDWKKVFEEERPHAITAVRRMLILDAVAEREKLEVTENELSEEFEKLARGSQKSPAAIRAQFEKDKRIHGFIDHLRQKKALDFIYRNANITRG